MQWLKFLEQIDYQAMAGGILFLLIGIALIRVVFIPIISIFLRSTSPQFRTGARKLVWYAALFLLFLTVLQRMGVEVTGLLGAAGIAGVAVGVASQSSLSNIIAGLFLVSEKAFSLGDVIKVDTTVGVVHSVDLLAVRLRTFDNTLIRIPHQKLITSVVTNVTRFPVRRMDFNLRVPYGTDLTGVEGLLKNVVTRNPLALNNPEPFIMFTDFSSSGVELLLGVWFEKTDYVAVKNSLTRELLYAFEAEGIQIPFPHIHVVEESNTAPGRSE